RAVGTSKSFSPRGSIEPGLIPSGGGQPLPPAALEGQFDPAGTALERTESSGRGVRRAAAGRRASSASIDVAAAVAASAQPVKVRADEATSSCVPRVGAKARPTHQDSPMVDM